LAKNKRKREEKRKLEKYTKDSEYYNILFEENALTKYIWVGVKYPPKPPNPCKKHYIYPQSYRYTEEIYLKIENCKMIYW
jgi:hypothetical protein